MLIGVWLRRCAVETEYEERVREGNDVNWKESKEIIRHFRWMFLALALARGCVTTEMNGNYFIRHFVPGR